MSVLDPRVAVAFAEQIKSYPVEPPFDPPNPVYSLVQGILAEFRQPFEQMLKGARLVVIKPNLVKHSRAGAAEGILAKATHGSVLRPIIDAVYRALGGKGRIVICDTPIETADFAQTLEITGIGPMVDILVKERGYPLEVLDLRRYCSVRRPGGQWRTEELGGDPRGYVSIVLGAESEFLSLDGSAQNYHTLSDHGVEHLDPFTGEPGATNRFHYPGHHEYLISGTILAADAVISVPKLKTHRKAGVTLSLKNTIGIVPDKLYMPHHRPGVFPDGDALPVLPDKSQVDKRLRRKRLNRYLAALLGQRIIRVLLASGAGRVYDRVVPRGGGFIEWGDWYGNDTLWRTILDLNKILLYADRQGCLQPGQQRGYFSLIDGIVGLEGEGPIGGEPKPAGVLIGGFSPLAVDGLGARVMGFDPQKIRSLEKARELTAFRLGPTGWQDIHVLGPVPHLAFLPPRGWLGFIERVGD